jgi:alpha-mannosidase
VRDAELGLRAVAAGPAPLVPPGAALLTVEPRALVVSALKPAEDGRGVVLRVLNPTDDPLEARVEVGPPSAAVEAVRLDETPAAGEIVRRDGRLLRFAVPPHALRSLRLIG